MLKQFSINGIIFKADPVKTKKLYAKQIPNISTANSDDVAILQIYWFKRIFYA